MPASVPKNRVGSTGGWAASMLDTGLFASLRSTFCDGHTGRTNMDFRVGHPRIWAISSLKRELKQTRAAVNHPSKDVNTMNTLQFCISFGMCSLQPSHKNLSIFGCGVSS